MDMPAISTESQEAAEATEDLRAGFDIRNMPGQGFSAALVNWFSAYRIRECLLPILRCICPIVHTKGWAIVSRNEHVREVLAHHRDFPVPWGWKMELASGPAHKNFILGMADGSEYRRSYRELTQVFSREDIPHLERMAARISEDIVSSGNRLDAVRQLMWAVPAQMCKDYYGLHIPDRELLTEWSIALSDFMFGPPVKPDDTAMQFTMQAAAGLRGLIQNSIGATRRGHRIGRILPRMVDAGLSDADIVTHLLGMVTGFVPTNLLAGGNILDTLLQYPKFMRQTRDAALCDDDDLLWRCLQETLRFRYINVSVFRTTAPDGYTFTAGVSKPTTLPGGTRVCVLTQSAMFDGRQIAHPRRFDPNRPAEDFLTFGYGQHWCLGTFVAKAQLTQMFKVLLRRRDLRRAPGKPGRMTRIATFPSHLVVAYD